LFSLQGFEYCDLLLTQAEVVAWRQILQNIPLVPHGPQDDKWTQHEVQPERATALQSCDVVTRRARQTLKESLEYAGTALLDVAVDHLTLGRTALYTEILSGAHLLGGPDTTGVQNTPTARNELSAALSELDTAVDGFRRSGFQDFLARSLLTRAWLRTLIGSPTGGENARTDLDEAWEIAARGPMRLHMGDIHLYRARLFHDVKPYPWTSPQEDLAAARKLIEQCGYWRRKEELEDAEAAAASW
jgi:hypothetical protein